MTKNMPRRLGIIGSLALSSLVLSSLGLTGLTLSGQPGMAATESAAPAKSPTPESSSKKFGAWSVNCQIITSEKDTQDNAAEEKDAGKKDDGKKDDDGKNAETADAGPKQRCEMLQTLTQSDTGKRVLSLSLQKQDGKLVLVLLTPFGLDLAQKIDVSDGDKVVLSVPFKTCLPAGCIATITLADKVQGELSKVDDMTVALPRLDGAEPLKVSFPNTGFDAALADLKTE